MLRTPALLLTIALSAGTGPSRQQTTPLIRGSGTNAIVVDVIVRDGKGNPVTDLRKEDFVLIEDGVQQEIGDATRVGTPVQVAKSGRAAPPAPGTAINDDRAYPSFTALVFNRLSPEARGRANQAAVACLDVLHEGDYVGVFSTDLSLTTVFPYTRDRDKLRKALAAAVRRPSWSSPVGFTASGVLTLFGDWELTSQGSAAQAATQAGWKQLDQLQEGYATTDALVAIAAGLGVIPGRKTIVLFSEGIPVPEGVLSRFRSVIASANHGNVSVYPIDAAGLRTISQQTAAGEAVRAAGDAGLRVSPTGENGSSIGGMEGMATAMRTPSAVLTTLARETGGFAIESTNDLAKGLRQIDADRRLYYLLTYTPANGSFDGKWRSITVQVPGRKVTMRARSGYLAVRAPAGMPMLAYEGPALAALERSPAPADLPLRSAALVFPGGQLAVLAATDAQAIRFERDDKAHTYRSDFSILARIVGAGGEVVRKASQQYRLNGPVTQMEQAQRGEVLFFRQPALPPGSYTLEVAVHDALAIRSSVRRSTFVVPEITPSLQVSSLVVVQRTERVKPEERDKNNPLYAGDVLVYPNLGEPIRASRERSLTYYVLVAPGSGPPPQATLEVLHDGLVVSQSPAALSAAGASGRMAQLAQISIEGVASGRYTLRVTVTQGDRREVRDASFQLID